jgi:uncharacterized DUF497 family protein|tara:strand:- start:322 stop:549 length:228 start_codon:yes stop_codon:yes gene_type:complete
MELILLIAFWFLMADLYILFLSSQSEDEKRWVSICLLNSKEIATIWTRREPDIIRIISMRRARNEERKKYHELYS